MIFVAVGLMLVVAALNLLSNVAMVAPRSAPTSPCCPASGCRRRPLRRLFVLIGSASGHRCTLGAVLGSRWRPSSTPTGALPGCAGVFLASSVPVPCRPRMVALVVALGAGPRRRGVVDSRRGWSRGASGGGPPL